MKKLILSMFIVLGTMASVSAQSFDFSCTESSPEDASAFTEAQVAVLTSEDNGFLLVDDNVYDAVGEMDGNTYLIQLHRNADGSFLVYDENDILLDAGFSDEWGFYRTFTADQFDEAVAYALLLSRLGAQASSYTLADYGYSDYSNYNDTSVFDVTTGELTIRGHEFGTNFRGLTTGNQNQPELEWDSPNSLYGNNPVFYVFAYPNIDTQDTTFEIDAYDSPRDGHGDVIENGTFATAEDLVNRLSLPGTFSWVDIKKLLNANFEELSRNNFQIYSSHLGVYLTVSVINQRFNIIDGDGYVEDNFDTIEEVIHFVRVAGAEGFDSTQTTQLEADGLVFGVYDVIGANPARTVEGFQGQFISTNGFTRTFIVASSPNGAQRDLHDANGDVIGQGSFSYSLTGHNITPEYFATADAAAGRAIAINTRN